MKKVLLFCLLASVALAGCRKCRTCECTRGGQTFTEKECATGINQSGGLDSWQRSMMKTKGYDRCGCTQL